MMKVLHKESPNEQKVLLKIVNPEIIKILVDISNNHLLSNTKLSKKL